MIREVVKPIQNPYGREKRPYSSIFQGIRSRHKENAESCCGATAPGAKTKQGTTRGNNLGRIGKDEVSSSNLDSSSIKAPKSCGFGVFL